MELSLKKETEWVKLYGANTTSIQNTCIWRRKNCKGIAFMKQSFCGKCVEGEGGGEESIATSFHLFFSLRVFLNHGTWNNPLTDKNLPFTIFHKRFKVCSWDRPEKLHPHGTIAADLICSQVTTWLGSEALCWGGGQQQGALTQLPAAGFVA